MACGLRIKPKPGSSETSRRPFAGTGSLAKSGPKTGRTLRPSALLATYSLDVERHIAIDHQRIIRADGFAT
jgi:hypothetical protein